MHEAFKCVENEEDLGITFDSLLKFNDHISVIVNKENFRLRLTKRTFTQLYKEFLIQTYKSFAKPILKYELCRT